MLIKHYYDIGIAVGVDEGLVVPVLREADRKSFAEIERDIAKSGKTRTRKYPCAGGTARWYVYNYERGRLWFAALHADLECSPGWYPGVA